MLKPTKKMQNDSPYKNNHFVIMFFFEFFEKFSKSRIETVSQDFPFYFGPKNDIFKGYLKGKGSYKKIKIYPE